MQRLYNIPVYVYAWVSADRISWAVLSVHGAFVVVWVSMFGCIRVFCYVKLLTWNLPFITETKTSSFFTNVFFWLVCVCCLYPLGKLILVNIICYKIHQDIQFSSFKYQRLCFFHFLLLYAVFWRYVDITIFKMPLVFSLCFC